MSTFVVQFLGDWVSEKAHVLIKDSRHVFLLKLLITR